MEVTIHTPVGEQPFVRELARAMREGLEARQFRTPNTPREPLVGRLAAPGLPDREPDLVATRDVLGIPVPRPRRRLGQLLRPWRWVAKALVRPWLDHQTKYNVTVSEVLAQIRAEFQRHGQATTDHVNTLAQKVAAEFDERIPAVYAHAERCYQELFREQERLWAEVERARQALVEVVQANEALAQRLEAERQALACCQSVLEEEQAGRAADRDAFEVESQRALTDAVNRELGCTGTIARHGLYFNPPVNVVYDPARPQVASITERIVEHIFVHTRLPAPPARVLDIGCAESTNALEMASLGYNVVGVDLRPLPLRHPQLETVQANLAELPFPDESFDLAVSLSTIEHVGLGWYTPEEKGTSHLMAAAEVRRVLRRGGRLILTVPYGRPAVTPVHRIFDRAGLDELLTGFRLRELSFAVRDGDAWSATDDEQRAVACDSAERVGAVALVVAEKE